MAEFRKSSGRFVFRNSNPKGSLTSGDCVIRAISIGMGLSWEETLMELVKVGLDIKDVPNATKTYKEYFKRKGILMEKQLRKPDRKKYTLNEFAEKKNSGTFICNLANHLTVVVDGKIYDTWNNGRKTVGNYWEIK